MGFRQSIGKRLFNAAIRLGGFKQVSGDRLQMISDSQANQPIFSTWDMDKAIREGYKASVWVYACVRKITTAASSVPWYVEKKEGDEWVREPNHPVEILLTDPNPIPGFSGRHLFEYKSQHEHLGGNAIWYMVLANGYPVELWPLPPDTVKPIISKSGEVEYYEYIPRGTYKKQKLEPQNIVHYQFPDPANPYWGISPLMAAARIVDTDLQAIKWNKQSMSNRAIKDGILFPEEHLDKEQWEELRNQIAQQHSGPDNSRGIWVASSKGDLKMLSMTPAEMDFIESRKMNMLEIHAAFDVDPLLTGYPDRSGRSNKTEAKMEFWQDNIIPYLDNTMDALNNTLMVFFDPGRQSRPQDPQYRVRYDLSEVSVLKEDYEKKIKNAERLLRMGVPFNQINRQLGLGFEDIPMGDTPYGQPLPQEVAKRNIQPQLKEAVWSEAKKEIFWKQFDTERQQWENRTLKIIKRMFGQERDRVVELVKEDPVEEEVELAIEEFEPEWVATLTGIYRGVIKYFGESEHERIEQEELKNNGVDLDFKKLKLKFDPFDQRVQAWIERYGAEKVAYITETSKSQLREVIAEGLKENLTTDQIAENIELTYNNWIEMPSGRAMTIARTEAGSAAGYGHWEGARQIAEETGEQFVKEWISSRDERVRESHAFIDGERVALNEAFSNGLLYPLAPGPPEEVIHCRCGHVNRLADRVGMGG